MRKDFIFKRILFVCMFLVFTLTTLLVYNGISNSRNDLKQLERTVHYEEKILDQNVLDDFDDYEVITENEDISFSATKTFDMSILNEIDMVGLNETEETFSVNYQIDYTDDESAVLLTVTIVGEQDIPVIETIPGLTTINAAGEPDVMFVVDDEYVWLSDLNQIGIVDESGLFSNLIKIVSNVASTIVKAVAPIVAPAIRATVSILVSLNLGDEAAAIGGALLNMKADENGVYHANFDCWQSIFGYTDFYDNVFNASTNMKNGKFPFDVDGNGTNDYVIWLWKGDYLNLGAGAELGIYKRWKYSSDIWTVDKTKAMKMTLKLEYNNKVVFDWQPTEKQWWITGFNPAKEYMNANINNLKASYTITFTDKSMFESFKNEWMIADNRWSFSGYIASFKF